MIGLIDKGMKISDLEGKKRVRREIR